MTAAGLPAPPEHRPISTHQKNRSPLFRPQPISEVRRLGLAQGCYAFDFVDFSPAGVREWGSPRAPGRGFPRAIAGGSTGAPDETWVDLWVRLR